MYNMKLYGEKLKEIRLKLKLTQAEVAEQSYISIKTLRRIEKGRVIPNLDTLETLSLVYNTDLASLLLNCRLDDYSVFNKLITNIRNNIFNNEYYNLLYDLENIVKIKSNIENPYYINRLNQLELRIIAIIYIELDLLNISYDTFSKALKITLPNFSLKNYKDFFYTEFEIEILMDLAINLYKLNEDDLYFEILEFCLKNLDKESMIFPKICINLGNAYGRLGDHKNALTTYNLGIENSKKYNNLSILDLLYYGKGISEYELSEANYLESLRLSVYFCEAIGRENLKNTILEKITSIEKNNKENLT